MSSGKIIPRNKDDVERILSYITQHGDIPGYQITFLRSLYSKISTKYCDSCHNTGTKIILFPDRIETQDCQCKKFLINNQRIGNDAKAAGLPVRYLNASLANWKSPHSHTKQEEVNKKSHNMLVKYCEKIDQMLEKGYGLFLCGPNGVGKTYLACAVALEAIACRHSVRYYTMSKIVRCVVDGWYDDDKKHMIDDIENAQFLVIDDLDKPYQSKTGLEISVLDNLFRERLQNNRPIIVTSNKSPEQVKESHGDSIYSMLSEHCAVCVFLGSDYRKNLSKKMVDDILS